MILRVVTDSGGGGTERFLRLGVGGMSENNLEALGMHSDWSSWQDGGTIVA